MQLVVSHSSLLKDHQVDRSLLMGATEEHFEQIAAYEASVMKDMDAYIGLRSGDNINEQADVPSERMKVHGQTVGKKFIEIFAFQKHVGLFFATQMLLWHSLLK